MRIRYLFLLLFLFTVSCATSSTRRPASDRPPILLIGTTDFHGAIDPTFVGQVEIGGARVFAAMKDAYEKAAGRYPVVHVDAGDLFQGSMVSNMAEGAPVIALYNYMNVDAVA